MPTGDDGRLVWERQPDAGRTGRPALTVAAIVGAAIAIADAGGLEAATVRRIAGELSVAPMALYRHVARKEDLPDLMLDAVLGEIELLAAPTGDWRGDLRTLAGRRRAALIAHPWLAGTLAAHPPVGPNALDYLECCLSVLAPLGLEVPAVQGVYGAVDTYVTGFVLREMAELDLLRRAEVGRSAAAAGLRPYLEGVVATGRYPHFARLLAGGAPQAVADDEQDAFIGVLDCLLDGLEMRFIRSSPRPAR